MPFSLSVGLSKIGSRRISNAEGLIPTPDGLEEFPNEMILLSLATLGAQKFEFALYGMTSHLKATDGRFKGLIPEEFLRGDGTKTKATLGILAKA